MKIAVAVLTIVIGALAVLIAYFQWRTAHQRIVLDLFERRLAVFRNAVDAARAIVETRAMTMETFRLFQTARDSARFLFGSDVNDDLASVAQHFALVLAFTTDKLVADRGNQLQLQQAYLAIGAFLERSTPLFAKYMRMDQRMPGFWWPC